MARLSVELDPIKNKGAYLTNRPQVGDTVHVELSRKRLWRVPYQQSLGDNFLLHCIKHTLSSSLVYLRCF